MLKVQSKMCINYNDNVFKKRPYLVAVLLVFIIHVIVLLIDANYAIFILLYYNVLFCFCFLVFFFFFYKSVIFLLKSVHLLVEYIKYRYLFPASLTLVKHITYKDVSIC